MATAAEKAAFRRQTGEDWDSAHPLEPVVPPLPPPPPPAAPVPPGPQQPPQPQPLTEPAGIPFGTPVPGFVPTEAAQRQWETPSPAMIGPVAPKSDLLDPGLFGSNKLVAQLQRAPSYARTPYSHDWDQWLLSLPFEKGDDFYNVTLGNERQAAIDREAKRGQDTSGMMGPPPRPYKALPLDPAVADRLSKAGASDQQDAADIKGLHRQASEGLARQRSQLPYITNVFGQEVSGQDAMQAKGGQANAAPTSQAGGIAGADAAVDDPTGLTPTSGSSDAAIAAAGPVSKGALETSGKVVWMGPLERNVNGVKYTTDQYMTYNDALLMPTRMWSEEQIVAFQQATGVPLTGVVDDDTQKMWAGAVKLSNRYTMAGKHLDPMAAVATVIRQQAKTPRTSAGGGGGAGGGGAGGGNGRGGGGVFVPTDQAKTLLNQTVQKMAGREASPAEFSSFLAEIKAAAKSDDFDAAQFAQDWTKTHFGQQVGSYQAGTDYYSVIQQLIGGG